MKIYIPKILPFSLNNKQDELIKLFGEPITKIKYEIVSKELGIIIIENQNIYYLESSFNSEYDLIKNYKNIDLLVDKNNIVKIPLKSQFPVNYIYTKYIQFQFKINKKSPLTLIINYLEETENYEIKRVPVDFYFDYEFEKLDLNDSFFDNEFNRFLSMFN